MRNDRHDDNIIAFTQICHAHQLKVTPQRIAIFKQLIQSDTHPTADSVYQIMKNEFSSISFDTVHRTLLTFAEIGIVDVIEIFGGAKRFDPNVTNHHHLHCIQCGKILDFYSRTYDDLKVPESVSQQFEVISKRVVLKGICRDCRQ